MLKNQEDSSFRERQSAGPRVRGPLPAREHQVAGFRENKSITGRLYEVITPRKYGGIARGVCDNSSRQQRGGIPLVDKHMSLFRSKEK